MSPSNTRPTPTLNIRLLWRVMDQIRTHPDQWRQDSWVGHTRCRTTYCLAGWAYTLDTGQPLRDNTTLLDTVVPVRARTALGLTGEQASRLFWWTTVPRERVVWHWSQTRHPTFAELVERVEAVTGFRYDPAAPPADPDDEGAPVPVEDPVYVLVRQPGPDRELVGVG